MNDLKMAPTAKVETRSHEAKQQQNLLAVTVSVCVELRTAGRSSETDELILLFCFGLVCILYYLIFNFGVYLVFIFVFILILFLFLLCFIFVYFLFSFILYLLFYFSFILYFCIFNF
jgi:Flp pilus assembly protein TadB